MYMQMITHNLLVLAFKLILAYFQHIFYSLFNDTDSTFDNLLN